MNPRNSPQDKMVPQTPVVGYYTRKFSDEEASDSESSVESDCSIACRNAYPYIPRIPEESNYMSDGYYYVFDDSADYRNTSNTSDVIYEFDMFGITDESSDSEDDKKVNPPKKTYLQLAIERKMFQRRIADIDMAISWVLKPNHRIRILNLRFLPWWKAQKRKEIAEKIEKKAHEKLKEDERLSNEEIEGQNAALLQESKKADKKVRFSPNPPTVHVMRVSHSASNKTLQQLAVNRKRIQRKKIAEKKEKEAQEKLQEDERLSNEEIEGQNAVLLHESKEADKNVSDENTDACISLPQEEATYSGDEELGNGKRNVTPISTVEATDTDTNITLAKDRVTDDKGSMKDNIISDDIETKDNKNVSFDNKE